MRWVLVLLLSGCLEPRACRADDDCPFGSRCEVRVAQDGGICRQEGDAGQP
ncbi:MAG: hypothetical protein JNJ54_10635 [Myxococcaceae bacterium]|nr:hypothetical protein [Myxococcaceae bacterium]